ncbi:MAG: hypothetical protein L3K24_16700 [Gammaproteobacteria bacterium]|nr:hypothetical protein [Gammaproteobacteria bacterium]
MMSVITTGWIAIEVAGNGNIAKNQAGWLIVHAHANMDQPRGHKECAYPTGLSI